MILCRRYHERIHIGDDIIITVVGIRDNKVYIGIDAPDDVQVDREEVRDRVAAADRLAALEKMDEPHPVRRDARRANGEDTR